MLRRLLPAFKPKYNQNDLKLFRQFLPFPLQNLQYTKRIEAIIRKENHYSQSFLNRNIHLLQQFEKELEQSHQTQFHSDKLTVEQVLKKKVVIDGRIYYEQEGIYTNENDQVLLDSHLISQQTGGQVGLVAIQPLKHQFIAYLLHFPNQESATLQIQSLLNPNEKLTIDNVVQFQWMPGGDSLLFTDLNGQMQSSAVYKVNLSDGRKEMIYKENRREFFIDLKISRSKEYVIINSCSRQETKVFLLSSKNDQLMPVKPASNHTEFYIDHYNQTFYIVSRKENSNFQIYLVPENDLHSTNWQCLTNNLPGDVFIEDVDIFHDFILLYCKQRGLSALYILTQNDIKKFELPLKLSQLTPGLNYDPMTRKVVVNLQQHGSAENIYELDLNDLKQPKWKELYRVDYSNYDKDKFQLIRIELPSPIQWQEQAKGDWRSLPIAIPITLYYNRNHVSDAHFQHLLDYSIESLQSFETLQNKKNKKLPILLTQYNTYGMDTLMPYQQAQTYMPLLNRGWVIFSAHLRGGNAYGPGWYHTGSGSKNKHVVLKELSHLLQTVHKPHMQFYGLGVSAGGTLLASLAVKYPQYFKALVLHACFLDVVTAMSHENLPLTSAEKFEWGDVLSDYENIKKWSPIKQFDLNNNPNSQLFPALWVTNGMLDERVPFWHALHFIMCSRIQSQRDDIYLKMTEQGGHFEQTTDADFADISEWLTFLHLINKNQ